MGDFGRAELGRILRGKEVSLPEDCAAYGHASRNAVGGLSVEDPDKRAVYSKLQALHREGVRQAWLIRLEWSERERGLHVDDPVDAVRIFPVDLDAGLEPPLGPTQHSAGRLVLLDHLTQSALDRALRDEPEPVQPPPAQPQATAVGRPLAERSDADLVYMRKTPDGVMRRRHNSMTNLLKSFCDAKRWVVREDPLGYDALIENYVADRDVLIEVKTESTPPFVRMAVGQLLDYRRGLPRRDRTDLAVLLLGRPDVDVLAFLADVEVKALWLLPDDEIHGL